MSFLFHQFTSQTFYAQGGIYLTNTDSQALKNGDPLQKAIDGLLGSGNSCVGYAADGSLAFTSTENGVRPLMERIDSLRGIYVADKVIGKAAACVMIFHGVAACHGLVMSEAAAKLLGESGVPFSYGEMVPFIQNRDGTGMCPMERAVEGAAGAEEGFEAVRGFLGAQK